MSTLIFALFASLGVFVFSFNLWRRLKEDYPVDEIFSFTLGVLLAGLLTFFVATNLLPHYSFWVSLLAGAGSGIYFMRRFSFRFFEVVDALAPSYLWLSLFLSLALLSGEEMLLHLAGGAISLAGIFAYSLAAPRYRSFTWYPSGKLGFLGLSSLVVYFLLRAVVEITYTRVLSFRLNPVEVRLNLFVAILLFLTLYFRSGNKRAEMIVNRIKALQR